MPRQVPAVPARLRSILRLARPIARAPPDWPPACYHSGMSTPKPDTVAFLVRIPRELRDALEARATAEDRSMRSVVERALRAYLTEAPATTAR